MRYLIAPALLVALAMPVAAQEEEGPSLMERGMRLFMDGLSQEMEPAMRDLEGLAENAAPLLERLQEQLGETLSDLDAYHAPEVQPNGDILIRRKEPLPEGVEENPDGTISL